MYTYIGKHKVIKQLLIINCLSENNTMELYSANEHKIRQFHTSDVTSTSSTCLTRKMGQKLQKFYNHNETLQITQLSYIYMNKHQFCNQIRTIKFVKNKEIIINKKEEISSHSNKDLKQCRITTTVYLVCTN